MDPELLIVLFLILAPLLERLLKGGQKKKPPGPREREVPRREPSRRVPAPPTRTGDDEGQQPAARREEESAATILPDDLWEILTGERRSPQPVPVPQPAPGPYDESYDKMEPVEEWEYEEPVVVPEPVLRPRDGLYVPRDREEPQVVSLEPLELDDEARHRRFHERVSASLAAAPRPTAPAVFRFRSDEDLRRAMIVTEILGPPKGLQ